MSIELARRLVGNGAPTSCVDAALSVEIERNQPFVQALLGLFPELTGLVEREIEQSDVPEIHVVKASPELVSRLPPNLCERLLAVPVFCDPETGRVDVAAVDVFSPHIAAEFAYQLGARIRVLRAALASVLTALSGLRGRRSAPPIMLVRPSAQSARAGKLDEARKAEPVLNLTRSKVSTGALFAFERDLRDATTEIELASSPDAVAGSLARGFEPALALVLALRAGAFDLRATSAAFGPELVPFSVSVGKRSVFDSALETGHYLGPLPNTLVHAELRAGLSSGPSSEVYVAPVLVQSRPALVLLISRMGPSLEATRRADRLIAVAAEALERIVLVRKQR